MLDKTLDWIEKYAILKMCLDKHPRDEILIKGLEILEGKVKGELETEKKRQEILEKNRKRIEAKQLKLKKEEVDLIHEL